MAEKNACLVAEASSTIHDEELGFEVQMENRSPRERRSRNGFHHLTAETNLGMEATELVGL